MIRLILNILWFILGGWLSGLLWLLGGAILALTVVGLPYTMAAWRIAGFSFWPFGKEVVSRESLGMSDAGTGGLGVVLSHLIIAVAEFVSIIGIPFALKDLQLAILALAPVGKTVVEKP